MRVLIIDDMIERHGVISQLVNKLLVDEELEIIHADSKDEAIKQLDKYKEFDVIFLDHDLGGPFMMDSNLENTGYQVAKYIEENNIEYKDIIVHSINLVGARNIQRVLEDAQIVPYHILIANLQSIVAQ